MSTYSEFINKTQSEKITLVWLEPSERLLIWTLDSGAIYKRVTDFNVIDILNGTTPLTEASSSSLSAGQWFYDVETKTCYIRMGDDSNPNTQNILANYRLTYATAPLDLPLDLDSKSSVHYEGVLSSTSPITKALDYETVGVAQESTTSITLDNRSGLFDDFYDSLFFENKEVKVYSWSPEIPLSEKQLLFEGLIEDKSFSTSKVVFKCKDFVFKLRQPLSLDLFSSSDGNLSDFNLNKPKRRIYGQVDNVRCVALDNILDGYTLTGTISGVANSELTGTASGSAGGTTVSGVGTLFLTELFEGATVSFTYDDMGTPAEGSFTVLSITNDTTLITDNTLSDTFNSTVNSEQKTMILTGVGTSFLDECSPSDKMILTFNNEQYSYNIDEVVSDTRLHLSDPLDFDFVGETFKNLPNRPWRKKNRNWHIAGHKLRAPATTVSAATQPNRFDVVSGDDFFSGDIIKVDGESAIIKRVNNGSFVLESNLQGGTPSVSDTVTKNPVSKAYFGSNEIFIDRDFTVANSTEAIINLTDTVELDLARARRMSGTLTFTNNSREVTATGIDLVSEVAPRDWIRSSDISHTTWYEVLSVTQASLFLRVVYTGETLADTASQKKNVNLIEDLSLITVNCIGLESSGEWVKSASDAVKHLLENDASITNLNAASFTTSDTEAPFTLSMVIPETVGGQIPKIRDVITKINGSVFGSLINNSSWELFYNVLTPEKPTTLDAIEDHDIIGEISVKSRNKIVRKVNAQYRPFVDRFTNENSFKLYEYTSSFVDFYIGAKAEKDVTLYLYKDSDAQEIAERYALYNSLSQSVVQLKSKLNFMLTNLSDKIYLNLDRLYKRFGGRDRKKIGVVNSITKNGSDTNIELVDLGNSFNRVMSIADNSDNEFTSASENEKLVNGYVLDNDLETPETSDDQFLGTSIIG